MSLTVKVEGKSYKLHRDKLASWSYFTPLLEGRWGDKPHELPLNKDQYQAWTRLTVSTGVVSYSSVIDVVDLLLPENDEWTTRVYLDDATTQEQRMEHYERVGNYVRAMGKKMPYVGKKYGIHANFSLHLDPVYKGKYTSELTEEQREVLLGMRNLSLITGIVHDTWLRCRAEELELEKLEEVPWYMVRWQDVAAVRHSNILNELGESVCKPSGITKPGVADSCRDYLIDKMIKRNVPNEQGWLLLDGLSWSQQSVGNYLGLLPDKPEEYYVSNYDFYTMRLFSRQEGEKTLITTDFPLSDSMLPDLYLAILRRLPPIVKLSSVVWMGPITGTIAENQLYRRATDDLRPYTLVTYATTNILYRGESLVTVFDADRAWSETQVACAVVNREDFGAVVQYGLDTVGAEAMLLLADIVMKEQEDCKSTERAKLFYSMVREKADLVKYPPTCLP